MTTAQVTTHVPWNHGRIIGPKPLLKPKHIWAIRTRLQHDGRVRDLAMFNVAIDSKLRGCDLVKLRVSDIHLGDSVRLRTTVVQQKTGRPVPFELTDTTREALAAWLKKRELRSGDWLFPSQSHGGDHIATRQYSWLVDDWVALAGLDPAAYGTHSLRRTKVALVYKRKGNLRACSSCSATRSWRAPFATSASKSTTPWSCPSKLTSDEGRGVPEPPRPAELGGLQSDRFRMARLPKQTFPLQLEQLVE